jgi:tail assembly chaperone
MAFSKPVIIEDGDTEIKFKVGAQEYEAFNKDLMKSKGVSASKNFLRRTVEKGSAEIVDELIRQGLAFDLAAEVMDGYKGTHSFTVKK